MCDKNFNVGRLKFYDFLLGTSIPVKKLQIFVYLLSFSLSFFLSFFERLKTKASIIFQIKLHGETIKEIAKLLQAVKLI